jgi:hypothetical protein
MKVDWSGTHYRVAQLCAPLLRDTLCKPVSVSSLLQHFCLETLTFGGESVALCAIGSAEL